MADSNQFLLPDIGEGLTEAEIVTWLVREGDPVELNQVIVEIETAKSAVELPSPYAGVVAQIHVAEGQTALVGRPIITIGAATMAGEPDPGAAAAPAPMGDVTDDRPVRTEVLVGYGPSHGHTQRRPRRTRSDSRFATSPPTALAVQSADHAYATPPVRKLARELGVDLAALTPTGPRGNITRQDVQTAATGNGVTATSTPASAAALSADMLVSPQIRIPIRGVRKHTAEAMVTSAFTAPHVTEWLTVDVTRTVKLVRTLRVEPAFDGVRLSPLVIVMRATLLALGQHPEVNARWDADAGEIVQYRDVNLGVAAATARGLLVPNIRAAQTLSTRQLALALTDLVDEARAGRTPPGRMQRGTFTITNIGVFGIDGGTPIINPGESAILCVGQIARRPWEHAGKVKLRDICTLSLSFDHRLIDGELGSKLLATIAHTLEQPAVLLAL